MSDPIVKTVIVNAPPDRAFDIFVNRIAKWWPLDGHAVSVAKGGSALSVAIEPFVGGSIYETMFDGAREEWGKILAFEAGRLLSMSWHPGTPLDQATRVDVQFEGAGSGQTLVTLTHSGWDVLLEQAANKRGGYDTGWDFVLGERYVSAVS